MNSSEIAWEKAKEKGSASAIVLGVAGLVLLVLIGLGFHAYRNPIVSLDDNDDNSYVATSTIGNITSTTTVTSENTISTNTYTPPANTTARRASTQTGSAYQGVAYRNSAFGLTVPGSYQTSMTQRVYAGVPTTASIDFFSNGVYAYTINIWSKEQWNDIRIQETRNAKEGTGPTYLGEGRYIGENKTWIYSQVAGQYGAPSNIQFFGGTSIVPVSYSAPAGSAPQFTAPSGYSY